MTGTPAKTAIVWFRRDLRLAGNPAWRAAARTGARLLALYVHAPEEESPWPPGAASRWWLHRALRALDARLRAGGGGLVVRRGASTETLCRVAEQTGAREVHWNRLHEPGCAVRDARVARALRDRSVAAHAHETALLFAPGTVMTGAGRPYRKFTPFWNTCLERGLPGEDWSAPTGLTFARAESAPLESLGLLPRIGWDAGLREAWTPGEEGARAALEAFIETDAADYAEGRDRPALRATSRLSPHLHFGEIGPRQLVAAARARIDRAGTAERARGLEAFLRELGWREFAHHLLHHFPGTPAEPLDPRFRRFPWASPAAGALEAWHRGRTGIPLVDAGMRELWQTGWMHNRVRMVTASFLTKNLLVPWQEGARWFWDTLVDADLANNTLGWQWVAGCGADAAPYFRVFNPVAQGRRFDPEGRYLRRWLPELAALPDRYLHAPWEAPSAVLEEAGMRLGDGYPRPIVDLAASRARALAAHARIRGRAP